MQNYEKLISSARRRTSEIHRQSMLEEAASDRSRVLYSSPFRRLQEKAQVFSLEGNAAVRTRLTHTLEVADVGRLIAQKVVNRLVNMYSMRRDLEQPFILLVETACLIHDLGNPPFGHFGEAAIRKWFSDNWRKCYAASCGTEVKKGDDYYAGLQELVEDFVKFDGNPQGIRIVTHLQWNKDDPYGLNLTYSQILSALKYTRCTSVPAENGNKPGFFLTERHIIKEAWDHFGIDEGKRFPLAYLVEAADDIAYCISDIEDGIEKELINKDEVLNLVYDKWRLACEKDRVSPDECWRSIGISSNESDLRKMDFFQFKTTYTRTLIQRAADIFVAKQQAVMEGNITELFENESNERRLLKVMKETARETLFNNLDVEKIELAGYSVITGLLESYRSLLNLSYSDFRKLVDALDCHSSPKRSDNLDVEWRLFHRLPKKHIEMYRHSIKSHEGDDGELKPEKEWFQRAHLIVDYISGMTDRYALETYQTLAGVTVG